MKTKLKLFAICHLLSAISFYAHAQGTAFTYQGRLNTNGAPYSGSAEFQFTLWDAASGGNAVATNNPTSFIATVDNGLFTVTLDFGISPFNGQPRFLQTEVRTVIGPFATLTPRQPLTATPYALRALNLGMNGLAAGTYGNAVTFNNTGNSFAGSFAGELTGTLTGAASGDGSGLTNVNAATLGGLNSSNFWRTDGNAGTVAGTHFLGTKDNLPLEIRVNNLRALRIEPSAANANVTMAGANNGISAGVSAGTVGGGSFNRIYSTDNSFIGSGSHNEIGTGAESSFGGTGCNFIGGGLANYITTNCNFSFVGGGGQCFIRTNTDYGFVGGGLGCRLLQDCDYCAVVGGQGNNVASSTTHAFVGGGFGNIVFSGANYATIGGGFDNFISAGALYATVPGGFSNRVSGNYGFAAGRRAKADNDGAFVWADSTDADFASTSANQFLIRASGGVGIGTANPTRELEIQHAGDTELGIKSTDTGGHLWTLQSSSVSGSVNLDASFQIIDRTSGGARLFIGTNGFVGIGTSGPTNRLHINGGVSATAFVTTSDRNAKENFTPISPAEVLSKVAGLPITKWNFKEMKDGQHLGPMAQDFYAAFGLGGGETTITTVDADGVALAAIQGLNRKLEETRAENAALHHELAEIKLLLTRLSERNN